ncbi:type IV pilin-like G/H family protein [Leptolyngbya sp. DQ-M1]
MEKSRFASNLADMSQPVADSTTNYNYSTTGSAAGAATPATHSLSLGTSKVTALRSYGGTVVLTTNSTTSETNTTGILCENNAPGTTAVAVGTVSGTTLACGSGSTQAQ